MAGPCSITTEAYHFDFDLSVSSAESKGRDDISPRALRTPGMFLNYFAFTKCDKTSQPDSALTTLCDACQIYIFSAPYRKHSTGLVWPSS